MGAGAEIDQAAIAQAGGDRLGRGGGYESTRIAEEQELRIGRGAQRRVVALAHRMDVGGLAGDRQLAREREDGLA
jgi:hypothetical protein